MMLGRKSSNITFMQLSKRRNYKYRKYLFSKCIAILLLPLQAMGIRHIAAAPRIYPTRRASCFKILQGPRRECQELAAVNSSIFLGDVLHYIRHCLPKRATRLRSKERLGSFNLDMQRMICGFHPCHTTSKRKLLYVAFLGMASALQPELL